MLKDHVVVQAVPSSMSKKGKYNFNFTLLYAGKILGEGGTERKVLRNAATSTDVTTLEAVKAYREFRDTTNDDAVEEALEALEQLIATI